MENHHLYFYTETIEGFKHLLHDDEMKLIITNSLRYLVQQNLVTVYAFVIMPNHIHMIWRYDDQNPKESSAGSFAKYTAHEFKKLLSVKDPLLLRQFASVKRDRSYQFWKRDPLAIPLSSPEALKQRLDYIHANPIKEKWSLCNLPEEYRWSSAGFYYNGISEFDFLTNVFN